MKAKSTPVFVPMPTKSHGVKTKTAAYKFTNLAANLFKFYRLLYIRYLSVILALS